MNLDLIVDILSLAFVIYVLALGVFLISLSLSEYLSKRKAKNKAKKARTMFTPEEELLAQMLERKAEVTKLYVATRREMFNEAIKNRRSKF